MTRQNLPPAGSFAAAAVCHPTPALRILSNKIKLLP
jgi:hypothetical protein